MRIIKSCPAPLGRVFRSVLQNVADRSEILAGLAQQTIADHDVFCDATILESCIRHVFENALEVRRHRDVTRPVEFLIRMRPMPDLISVSILNSNTKDVTLKGKGLLNSAECLKAFGGTLEYRTLHEGRWTFSVELRLDRWEKQ